MCSFIQYAFSNFSNHYVASHTISKDLVVDDAMMQQFEDYLKAHKITYTDKDIADNLDWIKASIKAELFTSQFGQIEGLKVRADWDPQIKQALTYMPEALASGVQTAHREDAAGAGGSGPR